MNNDIDMPWQLMTVAGTKHQWWPTDTQARFNEMMQDPVHRENFRQWGWDQPDAISYCFNQQGFRDATPDAVFDPKDKNLLALGCSFTMGIGLPYSDLWPTKLAQALNLRACNFGWPGGSSDRCFRIAEYWIPYLKPSLVVLLNPPRGRLEIIVDEKTGEANDIIPGDINTDTFVKRWISVDANQRINNRKNSLAIEAVCARYQVPFLSYEADVWMSRSREIAGYARDYFHAGPPGHLSFTEQVINDWSKKYA